MNCKKLMTAIFLCGLLSAGAAETLNLRGYGKVTADFGKDKTVFICESAEKADILYAKLYNDLTLMETEKPKSLTFKNIPMLCFSGNRVIAIGRNGNSVIIPQASSPEQLAADKQMKSLTFPARKPYPVYLDHFDLRSVKFYKQPMMSLFGYGLDTHWPFAKKFNIAGFTLHSTFAPNNSPAPGVINFTEIDYALEDAKKNDGIISLCNGFGGALPLWMYNLDPKSMAKVQNSTIVTEWQHGVEASQYESYGPGFKPEDSPLLMRQKKIFERYRNHPNLGSWQLYRGAPIGDQLGVGMYGVLWDGSEGARKMFAAWLKEKYKTPEALNQSWYHGKAKELTFEKASESQMMDLIGGDYDAERLLLSDREWEWAPTPVSDYNKYPAAGTRWLKLHLAPSQRAQYVDSDSGYYRITVPDKEYLKKYKGKKLYLRAVVLGLDSKVLNVWINGGKKLISNRPGHATAMVGIELPIDAFKCDGTDEIVIQTPNERNRSDGRIHGPISLSPNDKENFPYKDPGVNHKYCDLLDFQNDMLIKRNKEMYLFARSYDPDRPMTISGADATILGKMARFCAQYGISQQSTSIDAFFYPQLPDRGSLYGFYFIAEPSSPLKEKNFLRVWGQQFYLGSGATSIFMDIEQYIRLEAQTGLMTKYSPMFKLLGKYLLDPGKVGLLSTTESLRLRGLAPWTWQLGRGELASAQITGCMLDEISLSDGFGKQFPVIVDCSDIMTDFSIQQIKKYVEDGGTFIALPPSGRHTESVQNAQPLSQLSGFKVVLNKTAPRGNITFTQTQNVFPLWKGKTMNRTGNAVDWKFNQYAVGVRLQKAAPDVEIIASWQDGSPAIGVRKLGKGKIITMGSGFFRDGRDIRGKWLPSKRNILIEQLFEQLGIQRNITCDNDRVWLRTATSKNGLERWIIAINVTDISEKRTEPVSSIRFKSREAVSSIRDAITGKNVPFTREADGTIVIPNLKFERDETKIFAIPRPVSVGTALQTWWGEKKKYMSAAAPVKQIKMNTMPEQVININQWQFIPDPEGKIAADGKWSVPEYNGTGWKDIKAGSWRILRKDLAGYKGTCLYRKVVSLPDFWKDRTVTLNFNSRKAIQKKADFFVNGSKVFSIDASKQHIELHGLISVDVTPYLKHGSPNVISVKVQAGDTLLAGVLDSVFLAVERRLNPAINLNGDWNAVRKNLIDSFPVRIPTNRVFCRYVTRKFNIPADWKGKRIFLRLETPKINISSVVINNRGKGLDGGFPPFGTRTEINVTGFVKPGEENTIELWHRHTIPTNYIGLLWKWPKETNISVSNVTIGVTED